ncbi:MAG TPA: hypothetical protein PLD86_09460, partial [Vicinamibacteria bacterium]|nr:hypothetical protein [Vicinamibacteria bacterium]
MGGIQKSPDVAALGWRQRVRDFLSKCQTGGVDGCDDAIMHALTYADEVTLLVGSLEDGDPAVDVLDHAFEARLLEEKAFDAGTARAIRRIVRGHGLGETDERIPAALGV